MWFCILLIEFLRKRTSIITFNYSCVSELKLETCGSLEQENKNIVATSKSCSKSDQHGDDWLVVDLKLDFLQQKKLC